MNLPRNSAHTSRPVPTAVLRSNSNARFLPPLTPACTTPPTRKFPFRLCRAFAPVSTKLPLLPALGPPTGSSSPPPRRSSSLPLRPTLFGALLQRIFLPNQPNRIYHPLL